MNLQRQMVAIIFFAIFLWAVPVVVPDTVRRWRTCSARATKYQWKAQSEYLRAAGFAAQSKPRDAEICRRIADQYAKKSQEYRRSLLVPWEFWSMGDY
jgi:hypothetical protein